MNIIKKLRGALSVRWILRRVHRRTTRHGIAISLFDNLSPEANATVQSFNSRSAGGFLGNLKKMCNEGFSKVMRVFYSGYGHRSIGDCGSTTAALDGISMLGAKAWQDWPLYNGQETSTRFIKVTGLGYVDPVGTVWSKQVMDGWFSFYAASLSPVIEHLKRMHPKKGAEDSKKWATAIEKRAYDIMGAFLPAGARTNVSVYMTLRQWEDKLEYLTHHPVEEIRVSAENTRKMLQEKYPSTFSKKTYPESEEYRRDYMRNYYLREQQPNRSSATIFHENFRHPEILARYRKILERRPPKTDVFKALNGAAGYRLEFEIDYRSFRDLQRQRSAVQEMPILTHDLGFEEWYLDQLPEDVRATAEELLEKQKSIVEKLSFDPLERQYFIPMGYKVSTAFTFGLADLIYVIELRTPSTVHPTARVVMQRAYKLLRGYLPAWVAIHADMSPDALSIKRADHDLFLGGKRLSEI